jgi:hypothetical protein
MHKQWWWIHIVHPGVGLAMIFTSIVIQIGLAVTAAYIALSHAQPSFVVYSD